MNYLSVSGVFLKFFHFFWWKKNLRLHSKRLLFPPYDGTLVFEDLFLEQKKRKRTCKRGGGANGWRCRGILAPKFCTQENGGKNHGEHVGTSR